MHVSQISNQHVAKASDVLQPGQEVQVKVLAVEPDRKRISLSIREANSGGSQTPAPRRDNRKSSERTQTIEQPTTGTGATLGDLFGDLFK